MNFAGQTKEDVVEDLFANKVSYHESYDTNIVNTS